MKRPDKAIRRMENALVSACELPGDHCEVEQALPAAITVIAKALGVPPNT